MGYYIYTISIESTVVKFKYVYFWYKIILYDEASFK